MNKEKYLHQQLNRPSVPNNLEQKILDNWQQQIKQQDIKHKKIMQPVLATAVSFIIVTVIFWGLASTPPSVIDAVNDLSDAIKHSDIGQSIALDEIQDNYKVEVSSITTPLKMTKYCNLNGVQTLHIQVEGRQQGEVHYFIRQGEFDMAFWQPHHGEINHMPWKMIKPREGLSVLIFYSPDMNPENADQITQKIFYS